MTSSLFLHARFMFIVILSAMIQTQSIVNIPINENVCASQGQCYNPILQECSYYAPCPYRNYCHDELTPTCRSYPNAICRFTGCGGCTEYFVDFNGDIVDCDKDKDICSIPKETGPCRAAIPRYYFNINSGQCEIFTYGGCRGNENNFNTLSECERSCGDSTTTTPACVPEGYKFVGDMSQCARIRYICESGYEYWSDSACG
eukprot:997922_1